MPNPSAPTAGCPGQCQTDHRVPRYGLCLAGVSRFGEASKSSSDMPLPSIAPGCEWSRAMPPPSSAATSAAP